MSKTVQPVKAGLLVTVGLSLKSRPKDNFQADSATAKTSPRGLGICGKDSPVDKAGRATASVVRVCRPAVQDVQTAEAELLQVLSLAVLKPRLKYAQALKTFADTTSEITLPAPALLPDAAREKILLPGIKPEVLDKAKLLAQGVKVKLAAESGGKPQKRVTHDHFRQIQADLGMHCTPEEETLAAFYCIKTDGNPDGFLSGLPIGMVDQSKDDFTVRARALVRHNIVDLRDDIKTARALETFSGWGKLFQAPGLTAVIKGLSIIEIQQITFPGIFCGADPPVRMWYQKIDKNNGTEGGKEVKQFASAWILTKGTSAYNLEKRQWNLEVVRKTNWHTVFHDNGLYFRYSSDSHIHSLLDPFRLAAEAMGIEEPFGIDIENGKIPPWYITREGMWTEISAAGRMLIDDVTEYLLTRQLPLKYPECFDEAGNLKPDGYEKIKWSDEYTEAVGDCHCLQESGMKTHEAVARVRPDFFGYERGQKRLAQAVFDDKWKGKEGRLRFRREIALGLVRAGMKAEVDLYGIKPGIRFVGSDFSRWVDSYFVGDKTWLQFFRNFGLESGLRHATDRGSGNSMGSALGILFDLDRTCRINLKQRFNGFSLLRQAGIDETSEFFIPLDSLPGKDLAVKHFSALRNTPQYDSLLKLRAYYWKKAGQSIPAVQKKVPRPFLPDIQRDYVYHFDDRTDTPLNPVKLTFNLFLHSLATNQSAEDVFRDFALRYIDPDIDAMDYSNLMPPEIFEIACMMHSVGNNDDEVPRRQTQEGFINALALIIRSFEIPNTASGREMIDDFFLGRRRVGRHIEDAFNKVYAEAEPALT